MNAKNNRFVDEFDVSVLMLLGNDWEATARNVRIDYTSVDIDGRTYWYR